MNDEYCKEEKLVPILDVIDLCVAYGSVQALHGVSLNVYPGELVSICGVNGAGKSTILRAVSGVLKPQSGKIIFNGIDIAGRAPENIHKMGISMVPEGRQIFSQLTVFENLRLGAFGCYKKKQFESDLQDIFSLFPILKERITQGGGLLSGGEQQMLAIARGLVSNPSLLILDEPSLGLSPNRVDQIFELIERLKNRGITILLVEQNAERAIGLADRAYILANGKVEYSGKADEIDTSEITSVYLNGRKGSENS